MEISQTLEFVWDSQIDPTIELNMVLNIIIFLKPKTRLTQKQNTKENLLVPKYNKQIQNGFK